MGRAGEPGVVDVCADPPMRADGLHTLGVVNHVMHISFYEDRPSDDEDGQVERHITGHLAIQMSGIPDGLVRVSGQWTAYAAGNVINRVAAPEQLMSWLAGLLIFVDLM